MVGPMMKEGACVLREDPKPQRLELFADGAVFPAVEAPVGARRAAAAHEVELRERAHPASRDADEMDEVGRLGHGTCLVGARPSESNVIKLGPSVLPALPLWTHAASRDGRVHCRR